MDSRQSTVHPQSPIAPLTGLPGLYAYQHATAEALFSGRRVMLRAPAGGGKTLAAWSPWLEGRLQAHDFPHKMLHVLPGGAFFCDLEQRLRTLTAALPGVRVGVQTEGESFDPYFLSDAIITSVDHLLGVALHRPLGLHPGLGNINAGTLLGSYLIFDEFPALVSREALALWLGLLRCYLPTTPCLFTTAVMPRPLAERIAEALDAVYIDASDAPVGGRRDWETLPVLTAEAILRRHRTRTIVVCNTVRGAQTLYRALAQARNISPRHPEILLLHQHQLYHDRRPIEERAGAIFSPGGRGNAVLVTTSGVKVGADLSADLLISDPAAPNILLRRAGRCARFPGEEGRVIVAAVTEQAPGLTYPAPPWQELVHALADGTLKTFAEELAVHDAVWADAAPDALPDMVRDLPTDQEIDDAPGRLMGGAETFPAHLFPRVGVALHRVPETLHDPFELERFSMGISSLERGFQQWQASGRQGEWFALIPHWSNLEIQTPTWTLVEQAREFHAAARLIVMNAETVSYDPILGLEMAPGTPYQSERLPVQHTTWSPFDQHVQSYDEHAHRALDAFEQLAPEYRFLLRHLGAYLHIPQVELEQWLRVCILWHDAGKLTADWQRAAFRWQAETIRRPIHEGVLARIDYQHRRDGDYPCPPHAHLSGYVTAHAIAIMLANRPALQLGTTAALNHHHGFIPMQETDFTPHPEAWATLIGLAGTVVDIRLARRMDRAGWALNMRGQQEAPLAPPTDPHAWMAYSLLVRAIRLADREIALMDVLS